MHLSAAGRSVVPAGGRPATSFADLPASLVYAIETKCALGDLAIETEDPDIETTGRREASHRADHGLREEGGASISGGNEPCRDRGAIVYAICTSQPSSPQEGAGLDHHVGATLMTAQHEMHRSASAQLRRRQRRIDRDRVVQSRTFLVDGPCARRNRCRCSSWRTACRRHRVVAPEALVAVRYCPAGFKRSRFGRSGPCHHCT